MLIVLPKNIARPTAALLLLVFALHNTGCMGGTSKKKSLTERVQKSLQKSLSDSYHDDSFEQKLAGAEQLFEKKEFESAQKIYAELASNSYNPAATIERSRFMEGECLRMRKRFPAAVDAYNRLLQDFPAGVYSERGAGHMYAIAELWLKDIVKDIQEQQKDTSWVPKLKLPDPSDTTRPVVDQRGELLKTLQNVVNGYPTAPFADKAMFWAGYLNFVDGNFEEADHFFSQLVEMHKDSPLRQDALKYAVMAKNNSTGGAVYDGQKSAEALQLVHHMEATDPRYVQEKEKVSWLTRQKMAIRIQQAQKDFEQAEYYMRTDHPGPAFFYFDMVQRRYPGTKYSDMAKKRITEIQADKKTRTIGGTGSTSIEQVWNNLIGRSPKTDDWTPPDPTPFDKQRSGPKDTPPPIIPAGFNTP